MKENKRKNVKYRNYKTILIFVFSLFISSCLILFGVMLRKKNSVYTIKNSRKDMGVTHTIKGRKNDIK